MPQTWDPVSKQPVQKIAAVRIEPFETTVTPAWWQLEERR
jgi:hypothetical protein